MKPLIASLMLLSFTTLGWSEPQPATSPTPAPQAQQVVQNTNEVRMLREARPQGMRLVKAPAPKAEKKPREIKFRDFRTARDPYPAD